MANSKNPEIRAHIDTATRDRAALILAGMGLTIGEALRQFVRRVNTNGRLPWDEQSAPVAAPPIPAPPVNTALPPAPEPARPQLHRFQIVSRDGHNIGIYRAQDEQHAVHLMAVQAGCRDYADFRAQAPIDDHPARVFRVA